MEALVQLKKNENSYGKGDCNVGLLNNLEKGRLHTFRHTFATKLAQAGVGIYEIQQLLGHSDIRMTQKYAKLSTRNLQKTVKKLDEL